MRWAGPGLGVAISGVALAAVVWWIVKQPAPTFPDSAAGFAWIAVSLLLSLLALAGRGWRWHRIMVLAHIEHRRVDAFGLTAVGSMGNNVLPARGGELLKVGLLGTRSTSRRREILGTVIAERLLDAFVLAGMFVILSLGLADSPAGPGTVALIAVGLLAAFGALAGYLWLRRLGRFERFAETVRPVARASRLFAHPSGVPLVLASVAIWVVDGLNLVCIARSIGITLSPEDGALVVVLASLAGAIPAAPGFAGTFDAGLVVGLRAANITGSAAVSILLLARFMYFVPVTVIGLILLVTRYGGFRRLRGGGSGRTPADDQERLAEEPPRERSVELAARQPGAGS